MNAIEQSGLPALEMLNVLIIDDNLLVHNVLKQSFYALGIRKVRSAENAYYGLQLCQEKHFHVVLCAFNIKSDKDGFHLLEELKFKGFVKKTTVLIFLSTATEESLVNSIIELQPDDFWVKPLAIKTVQARLIATLKNKQILFNIYSAIDQREFSKAIYYADRHLLNEKLAPYHANISRLKGESLLQLLEFKEAETFYKRLFQRYQYSWVYLGYAKALLKQGRIDDIQSMLSTLTEKPETRFGAHDMLAQYYIEQEQYHLAYDEIKKATLLAPRNIERNKKSWDLARLNHDHQGQYLATRSIAHYAKNSIHDSPQLLLNVIRAGIDLACATPDDSSNGVLKQTDRYIKQLESERQEGEGIELFKQQLLVVKARLLSVRNERNKAIRLVENHLSLKPTAIIEDNLDKVKVLHELGMREEANLLLKAINAQISGDSLASQVGKRYIEQETRERKKILFTAKQLNNMAIDHFEKKRLQPALAAIEHALELSPLNIKLTLSQLKILIMIKQQGEADAANVLLAEQAILYLENCALEGNIVGEVAELTQKWQAIAAE